MDKGAAGKIGSDLDSALGSDLQNFPVYFTIWGTYNTKVDSSSTAIGLLIQFVPIPKCRIRTIFPYVQQLRY